IPHAHTEVEAISQRVEVELDDQERLVLPPQLGDRMVLRPGMTQVVEEGASADAAYLRVRPQRARLVDEGGVLVVYTDATGDVARAVDDDRQARIASLGGQATP